MTPDIKQKLRAQKRLSSLRGKVERGTATESEAAEVRAAPPPKMVGRRAAKLRPVSEPEAEANDTSAEPKTTLPPPPPPRVTVVNAQSSRWQDKYRLTGSGSSREETCKQIATAYCHILRRLVEFIERNERTPLLDSRYIDESVFPSAVVVADRLLPELPLGPETDVVFGTGLIVGQAAWTSMRRRRLGAAPPPTPIPATESTPTISIDEMPANGVTPPPRTADEVLSTNPRAVF